MTSDCISRGERGGPTEVAQFEGAAYRGERSFDGALVTGGAVWWSICDPNYQDCGGRLYSGGVYRAVRSKSGLLPRGSDT